ncbi:MULTISPECIES: flavohemoglobin expression-modulating QEGLA motif protein [unclassified Rhizobium]|uniref:flavohemoglobin expression-modulating QEGLA motif protein n=1 Tax=unclassified Rhizobium TaxID=2613769 RepID=UPI002169E535|nr:MULTISPECIES: flavohemoglobin expression-modulating QEGLA motif protein [unclassified Rhizobium]MCS3741634.1 uncharacterized protein (TIGR02421 family) [Rhizobium sp. BK661]MCS4093643.1 uncharacterized protein (TIGR02421 family) [Rhizobium sp. BK176]
MTGPVHFDQIDWLVDVVSSLNEGKAIRKDFGDGSRLHVDRLLPFLFLHIDGGRNEDVARSVVQANASYLVASDPRSVLPIVKALSMMAAKQFGAFVIVRFAELDRDRFLTDDAPYLPPFEVSVWSSGNAPEVRETFSKAVSASEARFRTPQVEERRMASSKIDGDLAGLAGCALLVAEFAPIYRAPQSGNTFPEVRDQLIATLFDAGLQACAAFIEARGIMKPASHRSLGRRALVEAVNRVDRGIDEIATAFDVLLAVTPINAGQAFHRFEANGFVGDPGFLYRPLTVQVEDAKQRLFSIAFDRIEDPVLYELYRQKQQEVDLQLSLVAARNRQTFIEFGRALYGPVEPLLLAEAERILDYLSEDGPDTASRSDDVEAADSVYLERQAQSMIAAYQEKFPDFQVDVEVRDDLPSGLMVSNHRLLISRKTLMDPRRVAPLLSHEIGVHLLTFFNGGCQGLRLFRSGLAGYEGMQEGLAVFAEYLAGGMTAGRLKLIAARVVACADMLSGAKFDQTFHRLVRDYGFSRAAAFNLTLRVYRGGGLAKDAIYLRGLLELLDHLKRGAALDPFWMGKISSGHFGVMEELASRGLLKPPAIYPLFLATKDGRDRLEKARQGLRPIDLLQSKEM